ncbi:MAG: hypothetical protein HYX66_03500 [Ignavibacteria bacterium]|nr:hypothetical protein [Ignavibacteria bacterium]
MKKVFLTLFILGGIIWLGGGIVRNVVAFDLFNPGTLDLKSAHTEGMRLQSVRVYALIGGWTSAGFFAAIVGGLIAFLLERKEWKRRAWIVMSAILFFMIVPIQLWMIWKDYRLWQLFDAWSGMPLAQPAEIISVFLNRIQDTAVSVANGLSFLIAITITLVLIWKPLESR